MRKTAPGRKYQYKLLVLLMMLLSYFLVTAQAVFNLLYAMNMAIFSSVIRTWYSMVYFFYVDLPMRILLLVRQHLTTALAIVYRKSDSFRILYSHLKSFAKALKKIRGKVKHNNIAKSISFTVATVLEIIVVLFWPHRAEQSEVVPTHKRRVEEELCELVSYEETLPDLSSMDDAAVAVANTQIQLAHHMHNHVPLHPFRAEVRVMPVVFQTIKSMEADSPTSFPTTPSSRATIMGHSLDRVKDLMFTARDKLRMETQAMSRDAMSRSSAMEAKRTGQFAVFDPDQTASGLVLTSGSHCAIKVGRSCCGCCRAKIPVVRNRFVYVEFSISVSMGKVPVVAVGLTDSSAPLNVMVGSWPKNVGIYTEGSIMMESLWHQSSSSYKLEAGSTVGMLMYLKGEEGGEESGEGEGKRDGGAALDGKEQDEKRGKGRGRGRVDEREGVGGSTVSSRATGGGFTAAVQPARMSSDSDSGNDDCFSSGSRSRSGSNSSRSSGVVSDIVSTISSDSSGAAAVDAGNAQSGTQIFVINVNGKTVDLPSEANSHLKDIMKSSLAMYPTACLFSDSARVWSRFCSADMVYRTRGQIGAPPGVRVYCLDGSLLLSE